MSSIPSSAMPHAFTAPGTAEPRPRPLASKIWTVATAPAMLGLGLTVMALSGAARLLAGSKRLQVRPGRAPAAPPPDQVPV
jgi:hypothetical protein